MNNKLKEKLQGIASKYGKDPDLSTYVRNGSSLYLDEANREITFNHVLDEAAAKKIIDEIIAAMKEFGYHAEAVREAKLSSIVTEYVIKY